jgi:hypothetical protein
MACVRTRGLGPCGPRLATRAIQLVILGLVLLVLRVHNSLLADGAPETACASRELPPAPRMVHVRAPERGRGFNRRAIHASRIIIALIAL